MKINHKTLIISLINSLIALSLSGCSSMLSSKMPRGSVTMEQAYNGAINGVGNNHSVHQIRKKIPQLTQISSSENPQVTEIANQFPLLPNPNMVMYVYPHEVGNRTNAVPVPGYFTEFPLYRHVYYGMN